LGIAAVTLGPQRMDERSVAGDRHKADGRRPMLVAASASIGRVNAPNADDRVEDVARALDYLRSHHVLTLSVIDDDGPWAAALFYAADGFRCLFLSDPATRHARAVATNPRVAATIQDQPEDWTQIRGIQLEGTVRRLGGAARAAALARYVARFHRIAADPRLAGAFRKAATYELTPTRLFLVDNRRFGRRIEVPLTGPEPAPTTRG
jgi:uncharacterized protein YhbP (UPF0306 family)